MLTDTMQVGKAIIGTNVWEVDLIHEIQPDRITKGLPINRS
jgi:hypothetical protein